NLRRPRHRRRRRRRAMPHEPRRTAPDPQPRPVLHHPPTRLLPAPRRSVELTDGAVRVGQPRLTLGQSAGARLTNPRAARRRSSSGTTVGELEYCQYRSHSWTLTAATTSSESGSPSRIEEVSRLRPP